MSQPKPIESSRLPYAQEFAQRADDFLVEILTAVPELHGIALIPVWETQPENTSAGVFRLRNPTPPFAKSILALMLRMAAFNMDLQRDLVGQLQIYDRYGAELAEEVKARLKELQELAPVDQSQPPDAGESKIDD